LIVEYHVALRLGRHSSERNKERRRGRREDVSERSLLVDREMEVVEVLEWRAATARRGHGTEP
jgi:hypothetical protein